MSEQHGRYTRDETRAQKLDRNFNEQLQELRIAQAGVQILFAFLLTIPFQQRFTILTEFQRGVFLVTLVSAALSVLIFTAPVALHRVLFQEGVKDFIVRYTDRLMSVGLFTLAVTIIGGVILVLDVLVAHSTALWLGGVLSVVAIVLWVAVPWSQKSRDTNAAGRAASQA